MNIINFLSANKAVHETLFGSEWFIHKENPKHPAYKHWELCNKFLNQNGIPRYPDDLDNLIGLGKLMLDSYLWIRATKGNINQVLLGTIKNYGDETVQKQIMSQIRDPNKYLDILVEISFGMWNKGQGFDVCPLEIDGPDFLINIPSLTSPVYAECKNLSSISENSLKSRIKKINSQLKSVSEDIYGVGVIDINGAFPLQINGGDQIPIQVIEARDMIARILHPGQYRTVNSIYLIWDDCIIVGNPPERTCVAVRRRSVKVKHPAPRKEIVQSPELFNGFTIEVILDWF